MRVYFSDLAGHYDGRVSQLGHLLLRRQHHQTWGAYTLSHSTHYLYTYNYYDQSIHHRNICVLILISRVAIQSIERKRVFLPAYALFLQACRLAYLSVSREERVALTQLRNKVPIGYNGTPQIHPKTAPSLRRSPPPSNTPIPID